MLTCLLGGADEVATSREELSVRLRLQLSCRVMLGPALVLCKYSLVGNLLAISTYDLLDWKPSRSPWANGASAMFCSGMMCAISSRDKREIASGTHLPIMALHSALSQHIAVDGIWQTTQRKQLISSKDRCHSEHEDRPEETRIV